MVSRSGSDRTHRRCGRDFRSVVVCRDHPKMKHVGMRIKVLAKRVKASRTGRLHVSPGDSNTLTEAASRKTMLSEKSRRTGPRRPRCPQGRKKEISRSEQRKWNRRIVLCCVLVSAMPNGPFRNAGSVTTLPDRTAKQPFKRAQCSSCPEVLGVVYHSLFDARSLHRPDRCNKQGLRPRQDGQAQCQCRQRPNRHANPQRRAKICFGKKGHRHHNVTHYTDGQPCRPIVSMDLTETFTAHRTPVDLVQIAFEELAAAAGGAPSGYRANDRGPGAQADESLTDIGSASVAGDQAIGPIR